MSKAATQFACHYRRLALAEYNRVSKCLHLLDYANDKQLWQVIQESLNRGESLQGLKRALVSLEGNQFRGRQLIGLHLVDQERVCRYKRNSQ